MFRVESSSRHGEPFWELVIEYDDEGEQTGVAEFVSRETAWRWLAEEFGKNPRIGDFYRFRVAEYELKSEVEFNA